MHQVGVISGQIRIRACESNARGTSGREMKFIEQGDRKKQGLEFGETIRAFSQRIQEEINFAGG